MTCPRLVIADGHLGLWGALRAVYPEAAEQRCWNHKILNVLDKLPRRQQPLARPLLAAMAYAPTRTEAEQARLRVEAWCQKHGYTAAVETLRRDWDRMVTFYQFPKEHWIHLRTTDENVKRLRGWTCRKMEVDAGDPGLKSGTRGWKSRRAGGASALQRRSPLEALASIRGRAGCQCSVKVLYARSAWTASAHSRRRTSLRL